MKTKLFDWINKKSKYIFSISEDHSLVSSFDTVIPFKKLYVGLSPRSEHKLYTAKDKQLLVIGIAINTETASDNLQYIISESNSIDDVITHEYHLGGKYILLCRFADNYYLLPDATSCIPVFYNTKGKIFCSYCEYSVAKEFNYEIDPKLLAISESGYISQPMPYDVTIYRKVKQLLPNHYLDLTSNSCHRFITNPIKHRSISVETAVANTIDKITVLTKFYYDLYNPICPLTGGKDSRVVLAFMRNINLDTECYTTHTSRLSENSDDLTIPLKLHKTIGFPYKRVPHSTLPDNMYQLVLAAFGEHAYSRSTAGNGYSERVVYKERAKISGDIIGQIGKCGIHNGVPEWLASPRYFRCKLHKHSHSCLPYVKGWMKDFESSNEKTDIMDMFSIESRLGRWAAKVHTLQNFFGTGYYNIFNSRSVIYEWSKVSRQERSACKLHKEYVSTLDSRLLSIRFELLKKYESLTKGIWLLFFVMSFVKFYLNKYSWYSHKSTID